MDFLYYQLFIRLISFKKYQLQKINFKIICFLKGFLTKLIMSLLINLLV